MKRIKHIRFSAMQFIRRIWFGGTVVAVVATTAAILLYCLFSKFGQTMRNENQDDYLVAIFTVILGGGAIIQGMYLARQDRAVQESIKNANEGLEAAREANMIARDTAKQERRAYLSIRKAKISVDRKMTIGADGRAVGMDDYDLQSEIGIRNVGQTPASNVSIVIACVKGLPDGFVVDKWISDILADTKKIYNIYEYFGVIHSDVEITFEPKIIRGVKRDFKGVLWMVIIEYTDAFDDKHMEVRTEYIESIFDWRGSLSFGSQGLHY